VVGNSLSYTEVSPYTEVPTGVHNLRIDVNDQTEILGVITCVSSELFTIIVQYDSEGVAFARDHQDSNHDAQYQYMDFRVIDSSPAVDPDNSILFVDGVQEQYDEYFQVSFPTGASSINLTIVSGGEIILHSEISEDLALSDVYTIFVMGEGSLEYPLYSVITEDFDIDQDNTNDDDDDDDGLSGGAIAGIVIGTLVGVGILAVVVFVLVRKHRRAQFSTIG